MDIQVIIKAEDDDGGPHVLTGPQNHTVNERNPASQLIGSFLYNLQGFIHPRWLAGFLNHQQDHHHFNCY